MFYPPKKLNLLMSAAVILFLGGCMEEDTKKQSGSVVETKTNETKTGQNIEEPVDKQKEISVSLPKDFFKNNRAKLLEQMEDGSILVLFSERLYGTVLNNDDMHNKEKLGAARNFYYLTGIKDSDSVLMIKKSGDSSVETIFVPSTMDSQEVTTVSEIATVKDKKEFQGMLDAAFKDSTILYVDSGEPMLPERMGTDVQKQVEKQAEALGLEIKNIFPVLGDMRSIKTAEEIEMIKTSIAATKEGIYSMMETSKNGIEEGALEETFMQAISEAGTDRTSFAPIIAGGENALDAHYMESADAVPEDALVTTDVGAEVGYYAADITRTFPADGTFSDRQKELYTIVLKAQEEVIEMMKPGTDLAVLFETANKILADGLIKVGLIKDPSELSNYFSHGLFHPVGLDVHDVSGYKMTLEPGMVFAIEPGLYIPEEKIGIRIEDNVLVTEDGPVVLSKDIIKTVEEIENFMKDNNT